MFSTIFLGSSRITRRTIPGKLPYTSQVPATRKRSARIEAGPDKRKVAPSYSGFIHYARYGGLQCHPRNLTTLF
jgi:hypothetical protein